MTISSDVFLHNDYIPSDYTCDGSNISPPLTISQVPDNAQSLVLIVEDPDAPSGVFTHWLAYDIPPSTLQLLKNQPADTFKVGKNDFGEVRYTGPCPPSGTHHYIFKLYALDIVLNLPPGASKLDIQEKISGHELAYAEIVGLYSHQ